MNNVVTFDLEMQLEFANISGDFNPLHCDPVVARRLVVGKPMVHGIHEVLWAMDLWLKKQTLGIDLVKLEVRFENSLAVGQMARCDIEDNGKEVQLIVSAAGKRTAVIDLQWTTARPTSGLEPGARTPDREECIDLSSEHAQAVQGEVELTLDKTAILQRFPNLSRCLPYRQIAIITATSRIVGMKCPGLHSVFIGLSLVFGRFDSSGHPLSYRVVDYDERFRKVDIAIKCSAASGKIQAIFRRQPVNQLPATALVTRVNKDTFSGRRALIVGGSRGLGEVAAKLLSLGGAIVDITYRQGAEDARRVVEEISDAGGVAQCWQFDSGSSATDIPDAIKGTASFTHLYYFATPPITKGISSEFNHKKFGEYSKIYEAGYFNLVSRMARACSDPLEVFFPSTVYIDEKPSGFTEYITAKYAGELLGPVLEKTFPNVSVICVRLPMAATDQTSGAAASKLADPADLLLKVLIR
jgi:hypothetical protein